MNNNLLRAGALSCALLASTALTTPAMAQSAPPPRFTQIDANGVDLVSGNYFFSMVEGSIGTDAGMLTLIRNWAGSGGWTDNWSGALYTRTTGGVARIHVEFGSYSDTFTISGGTYTSTKADGATLVDLGGAFRYTAADGTQILYASQSDSMGYPMKGPACQFSDSGACSIPTTITRPNGMTYTMNWDVLERCFEYDGEFNCLNGGGFFRWRGVSNSANYSFTVNYATDTPGSGVPVPNWYVRDEVQFTNLDGAPGTLPTVTYSAVSSTVTDVTDTGGQTWRLTNGSAGRLTGIRRPGAGSDTTTISYSVGGPVSSVTNEGVTTGYSLGVSGSTGTMTVTDANSQVTTVVSDLTKGRPTSVTDPLSRVTSLQYDSNSRLTRVTQDETNYVAYTYDARGNVTETRAVAKSGSGLNDMVTSASYDSSCSNPVTCNRPNSVTDARGNVTDLTYDSTHGGVLTVTRPAPGGSGDRPQTRYSYTQVTAVTGQSVYLLTGVSACSSGTVASSCVGTTDESRSVIAYDTDNLRTTSVTARNGDNTLSATSAFTYDAIGNRLTVDGPISGSADTTRFRYDGARRVIGVVGADPDGSGGSNPLKHRAVRATYTNGLRTSVEQGNVDSQSDGDWAAFSAQQRVEQDYDANARPTVQRQMSGSTTYAVTQTSYDSLGRIQCVAQRMNPSEFASLPSDACTLDTEGSYGPDRITRTTYDNAGQVTKVETGYGVSGVAADEATTTWTNNGQAETVTDANGNRTTYVYDGHDRLSRTRVPHPSTAGTSSTTDYEELTYATATVGGNGVSTPLVASRRLRDTTSIAYSYDNLSRLTTKDLPGSEATVTYTYDLLGRLLTAAQSSLSHTLTFTYDALGRNLSQAGPLGTVSYSYDPAGRRTSMTYPGATTLVVGYSYNVAGDLTEIRENPAGSNTLVATYAYDDRGRRTLLTRGNGTTSTYTHDDVDRMTQLVENLSGSTYDQTLTFGYDPARQITSNTRTNDNYAWGGHYAVNRAYTANGLNQYTAAGAVTPTYDSRGNLTVAGGATYTYSSENMLVTATGGVTLAYDPLLRLYQTVGGSTTRMFYDGQSLIAEYDGSSVLQRRYVHGPGTDEPLVWYEGTGLSTRRYYHADERGSIVATSDGSGALVNLNSYDEYGIPASGNAGRFQYTGQQWLSELGMYHYRARIFSPTLGRFLQTDPIGFEGGMNLYAYVENDPVNFTDPLGLGGEEVDCREHPDDDNCVEVTGRRKPRTYYEWGYFDIYGGTGGVGGIDRPRCPPTTAVNISATLTLSGAIAGISSIRGTLTDVNTGEERDFVGSGPVMDEGGGMVGGALGWFGISGTLRGGFNALSGSFQIRFWNIGIGPAAFGGASIRNSSGDLGNISVSSNLAIPVSVVATNFYGIRVTSVRSGTCR